MHIDLHALLRVRLPTLALGLLNVAIALGILAMIFGGTRADEILATAPKPPPALAIDFGIASSAADFGPIQEQALMHASRSFYAMPPPDAVPMAPPLPDYRFAGSLLGPNNRPIALLAERQSGATRRVRTGDDLNGWQVSSVDARRVLLRWQEQTREIAVTMAQVNAGLTRVPLRRQRVAGTGATISLGAAGRNTAANVEQPAATMDPPRFYRPPPN